MNILFLKGIIIFEVISRRGVLHGLDEKEVKNKFVTDITKKIEIIADTLSLASYNERPKLLSSLEEKLRTAAVQTFGKDGDKYVDFIMRGIKLKAFSDVKSTSKSDEVTQENSTDVYHNEESVVKNHILKKISGQIEGYVNKYFVSVRSINDRRMFLENVRRKMLSIAEEKHLNKLNGDIASYKNVITNSLNDILKRNLEHNSGNIVGAKHENEIKEHNDELLHRNESHRRIFNNEEESLNVDEECIMSTALLCSDVNSLSESMCTVGDNIISVKNICDGSKDCPDGADEVNCKDQVANILNEAQHFLLEIQTAQEDCRMHKFNGTFTTKNVIYESIQTQINIINDQKNSFHINNDSGDVQEILKNVVNTLNKVTSNLSQGICAHQKNTSELVANARRFHQILGEDLEEVLRESALFPKSCVCSADQCISQTCVKSCKNACLLKYSLGRWSCHSVDGASSVSLDVICDGKFDCFDESDERGCRKGKGRGKFEANEGFLEITKILEMKMASKENEPVRNDLLRLYTSIIKLQNLITSPMPKTRDVKIMRDRSFMLLSLIYGNYMRNTYNSNNADEMYKFLNSINNILVRALKQSNTGNNPFVSLNNCICRKDKCIKTDCPIRCVRACAVESKFTRYNCNASPGNRSIPLEAICNGKNNCPKEEDEADCSKELYLKNLLGTADLCRRHHFYSLRFAIKDTGNEYDGTSVGAILRFWRMKATSMLLIAENNVRPNPKYIRKNVKDILQDLVYAYASLDPTRSKSAKKAFPVFFEISQKLMEALKTCGK